MTDNLNAPDPRLGEISKALDEFEETVVEFTLLSFHPAAFCEYENLKWVRNEKREKLMELIRRLSDGLIIPPNRVSNLINTSADDMATSLRCAEVNGNLDIEVLRRALMLVGHRGEKTKVRILQRYIRKMEKEAEGE